MFRPLGRIRLYLLAIALVAVASICQTWLILPVIGDAAPFSVFILAVLVSAWAGGLGTGIFATVISLVAAFAFAAFDGPVDAKKVALLAINGLTAFAICIMAEFLRRSQRSSRSANLAVRERESEMRLRGEEHQRVLNAIPHLVWTADEDGRLVYVNQRWRELLGDPGTDSRVDNWRSIVHSDDLHKLGQLDEALQSGSEPVPCEVRLQVEGNHYRWHLLHLHPSRSADRVVTGWYGTATDIDAARRAADAVRASEERFRNLANAAPILIWISDTSKACTWFNRKWLEYTGRPVEREIGEGWTLGVHPDDRDQAVDVYKKKFDAREPFEIEYRLRRSDGQYRWIYDSGTPVYGPDKTFVGYMGGCIDIHERKITEESRESLIKAEKAARSEAERIAVLKDEFLATVSHEIRTPLTAILGWAQLLRSGRTESLSQALETIERNARAQAQLIDDLLDMNRILSGRLRLDPQQCDPVDIIEAAIATARPAAAAKEIEIATILATNAGQVYGDPMRLQQVIWNLVNNAIKFTPRGGKVTVTLSRVGSQIETRVSDTGEGVAPEFLPYVFDRFRQADSSTSRQHQGLGLGLSIVKQLVELHGGTVDAMSQGRGTGATFTIRLPVAAAFHFDMTPTDPPPVETPAAGENVELTPSCLNGIDVLVVDDDTDARDVLRCILAANGADVRTASSAHEALDQIRRLPPNILVSDIGMPGMDGYALIRAVRTLPREQGGRVPAVALTAFARSEDRRRAIGAGFHIHLAKPIEPAELVTVVASLSVN